MMNMLLFVLMVAFFAGVLLLTGARAHEQIGRGTAGWWAGIVIALILLNVE